MSNYPDGCRPDDFDNCDFESYVDSSMECLSTFNTFLVRVCGGAVSDKCVMEYLLGFTPVVNAYIDWLNDTYGEE